ncbi:hypothetical protein CQA53_06440 [Helicobacter didelphidarum]|uniref:Class I SAM-dependent methyltransferase n=1 Tax=Helicobacter didelphidarum TaxID=2040648 RepID=A0A3D8IJB1_9HELI|nr:hypothetical protein [Helicobacter didelphidarum]RDU65312.1 hypothetical protein CQA53_06440 [Helicobacter didelphidarum]
MSITSRLKNAMLAFKQGGGGMDKTYLPMYANPTEIELFARHIINAKSYLEFGCGGSTFLVAYITQATITSIESSKDFIALLSRNELIANNLHRINLCHIDIGETGAWGFPIDESKKENYPLYSRSIFEARQDFDVIFVDGRFRVACILNAILYCPQSTIIVHDFFNREAYHIVLEFLECIERVETLGVFKVAKYDEERLKELYKQYQYDVK